MSESELNADTFKAPDGQPDAGNAMRDRIKALYMRYHDNPAYLATVLGGFCLISALILASSYMATLDPIAIRQKEDLQSSLALVIPASLHDNDLVHDAFTIKDTNGARTVYPAYRQGTLTAVAYQVSAVGYGGPILSIIGVDPNGTLLGVEVLQHTETPGLGDRIESKRGDWIKQFSGRSLAEPSEAQWKVKKDGGYFDQLSGATITPRAVVLSVRSGLEFFKAHKDEILTCPDGSCKGNRS
ncbi:RnfABCDGE type electron transport complex subunit G [Cohaesibacter haloalkalitolerans]|uniref:RnfABCDGE type electron transport complex subunit G n=1 Tax=Cohaesibacter haloalkalitolerans TaxID=1162980 RepID=UPI001968FB46|nr:RnfABCDGE type electron transport complex subunit G [Cohaesibacter haloalkalitolerans]